MDIIVTTPKSQMRSAALEAADVIKAGGGEYFRRLPHMADVTVGDRVFYVEDGFVRGFAVVKEAFYSSGMGCETTGRQWPEGFYVVMPAASWTWIKPIPYRGFMGFRYAREKGGNPNVINHPTEPNRFAWIVEAGGWLDPKPDHAEGGEKGGGA